MEARSVSGPGRLAYRACGVYAGNGAMSSMYAQRLGKAFPYPRLQRGRASGRKAMGACICRGRGVGGVAVVAGSALA